MHPLEELSGFYASLFTFPCVIILSTQYGELLSIATVFSPQKHIKIGIRQSKSVKFPGSISWVVDLEVLGLGSQVLRPGSRALGPYFRLCQKAMARREKICA